MSSEAEREGATGVTETSVHPCPSPLLRCSRDEAGLRGRGARVQAVPQAREAGVREGEARRRGQRVTEASHTQARTTVSLDVAQVYYPYLLMNKKRYAGLYWSKPDKYDKASARRGGRAEGGRGA